MNDLDLEALLAETEISRDLLDELQKFSAKLDAQISSLNTSIEELKTEGGKTRSRIIEIETQDIINQISYLFPVFLKDEIFKAGEVSTEYGQSILLNPLMKAAEKDENFNYTVVRHGWDSRLNVNVDMDRTAGTIEQWALGIKKTRELLGLENKEPIKASDAWRTKIWPGHSATNSPYITTMEHRFQEAGALAPYWELLDKGLVPMSSDYGGTAYPPVKATNFTEKTEKEIKKLFKDSLLKRKQNYEKVVTSLLEEKEMLQLKNNNVLTILELLEQADFDKIESIYAKFRNVRDSTNLPKLNTAILESLRGIGVSNVTKEGRLEITAAGASKRIRIPVSQLSNLSGGY